MTNVIDHTNQLSLKESIDSIKRCSLFLPNDSGPMHMADSLGIPTIGLFGAGNINETGLNTDYSINLTANEYCSPCEKNQCLNNHDQMICMNSLTPNIVIEKVDHYLKNGFLTK